MKNIEQLLSEKPEYKAQLFIRGYILTNAALPRLNQFPFYDSFTEHIFGDYTLRIHKLQRFAWCSTESSAYLLIGNCVNPITGDISEQKIVETIASFSDIENCNALRYINELTGNFFLAEIGAEGLRMLTDSAGMLFGCYGSVKGKLYVSSHTQLIADVVELTKSDYIKRLENYRFFYKYGLYFPGDLTQYTELRRLLQNHITSYDGKQFAVKRFYPVQALQITQTEKEYDDLLKDVCSIIHSTLACYARKYRNPAISLTGGMDSKTTLACANGLYDRYHYYSYVTMAGDRIDAEAAHIITRHLGLNHKIHLVSESDKDYPDIEVERAVLEHNNGGYHVNENDVRKRSYFRAFCSGGAGFDSEVKSWVSEIARANYCKKFGLKKLPQHLTSRNMTSMYKVFLSERRLSRETAKVFEEFIEKTGFHRFPEGYDESDMYLWEFRYSAWGGIVITSEHSYSNEILIPYNNRLLLDRMLQAPREKRITDEFHEDLIRTANKAVAEPGITITNWNETKNRMRIEKLYFLINSRLP